MNDSRKEKIVRVLSKKFEERRLDVAAGNYRCWPWGQSEQDMSVNVNPRKVSDRTSRLKPLVNERRRKDGIRS